MFIAVQRVAPIYQNDMISYMFYGAMFATVSGVHGVDKRFTCFAFCHKGRNTKLSIFFRFQKTNKNRAGSSIRIRSGIRKLEREDEKSVLHVRRHCHINKINSFPRNKIQGDSKNPAIIGTRCYRAKNFHRPQV